jgi:hydroxypyruvate isomerase
VPLLFAPNLSMLWPDQPFAQRFGRAARAGFRAVELWSPGKAAAAALPGLLSRWDVRLVLLNFDGAERPDTGTGAGRVRPGRPACRPGQTRHPLLPSG